MSAPAIVPRNDRRDRWSVLAESPEQHESDRPHDKIRPPHQQFEAELAVLRHAGAAEREGIVDYHDREEAGDERAEIVALAKPDPYGTADEDEEEASDAQGGSHLLLDIEQQDLLALIFLPGSDPVEM